MKSIHTYVLKMTMIATLFVGGLSPAFAGPGNDGARDSVLYKQEAKAKGPLTQVKGTLSCIAPETGPSCEVAIMEKDTGRVLRVTDSVDEAHKLMSQGKAMVAAEGYVYGQSFEVTTFN